VIATIEAGAAPAAAVGEAHQGPGPPAARRRSRGPAADAAMPLSPAVRRAVLEHGIDPASIKGTGKDGRITKEDVLAAAAAKKQAAPAPAVPPAAAAPAARRRAARNASR
jgi:2-oxoglutarate dehydrogenase E2 component (dihydrolipoamide succinyltransferase)